MYFPEFSGDVERQDKKSDEEKILKGNETILLVEDNMFVRSFAIDVLRQAGYGVIEVLSGEDALEKVKTDHQEIALLMTDIMLPGMSGKLLAAEINRVRPGIRVLFTSGYTGNSISQDDVSDDGIDFIAKPYSTHGLLKKVREVIDK